jgi:hypothetical protein
MKFVAPMIVVASSLLASFPSFSMVNKCLSPSFSADVVDVVGLAVSQKTGEPLYCEYHYKNSQDSKTLVEYRDLNNQIIARKELDFSSSLLSPSVVQNDLRHNELRSVTAAGDDNKLKVSYRKANAEALEKTVIDYSDTTVVDAGFDMAVRQSWDELVSGKKIKIDFVSPVHLTSIKLSIKSSKGRLCSEYNENETDQICFLVRPNNAVASLFVKPLVLVYQRNNQRLLTFSGSVNVTDDNGSSLKAVINYSYF